MVAATGAMLIGFLLVHAAGNLLILKGPDALNAYANWLQGHPMLWIFRIALVSLLILHVFTTKRLVRQNRAARPAGYRRLNRPGTGLPGRWMLFSGLMVLVFVILHLLHLTVRALGPSVDPLYDAAGRIDVYALVVAGFNDPLTAALYLVAMLFLGLHLAHAMQSLVQTLGFNHEVYQPLVRLLAATLTALIVLGFASIPLMVQLNVLHAGGS